MGRSKQSRPVKRRRVILDTDDSVFTEEQTSLMEQRQQLQQENQGGEEEMAKAIELLRKTPPDQVEAAAAEATRLDLGRNDRWIHLRLPKLSAPSSPSNGMATMATIFTEKDSIPDAQITSNSTGDNNHSFIGAQLTKNGSVDHDQIAMNAIDTASNYPETSPVYSSSIPSWCRGLGWGRLSPADFAALKKLHELIKNRINRKSCENNNNCASSNLEWASWSGTKDDPRKRAFVFLPGTWGYDPQIRNNRLDITMPTTLVEQNRENDERIRNRRAMLVLEKCEVPDGVEKAIRNLCRSLRACLLSNENDRHSVNDGNSNRDYRIRLAEYLRYEYMIAAQPNLHSGRALLPVHLDDPRKDGFGVIIVTVGMEGAGTILLSDAKGIHRGVAFRLKAGDAYMLSDRARDACAHGVLADGCTNATNDGRSRISYSERESLNLRFGLHDLAAPSNSKGISEQDFVSPPPTIPTSVVLQNWE